MIILDITMAVVCAFLLGMYSAKFTTGTQTVGQVVATIAWGIATLFWLGAAIVRALHLLMLLNAAGVTL